MSENPDTPKKASAVTGADIAQTEQERIKQEFLMEAQEGIEDSQQIATGKKFLMRYKGKPIPYRTIGKYFAEFEDRAISAERVQQIERKALAKLRERLGEDPLVKEYLKGTRKALMNNDCDYI